MGTRMASGYMRIYMTRRCFSGKILSEEERAAENVYIKKVEQEKLEKLARKGVNLAEEQQSGTGTSGSQPAAISAGVSTDQTKNLAVLAGVVAAASATGWYVKANAKKTEQHD